jgi:cytochrome c-type biogenesis protein CcmH/NrfF
VAVSSVLVLSAVADLPAQESGSAPFTPHPEAQAAIDRLKSPFCPGRMLSNCPSPYAGELRDSLQVLAEAGWTSGQLVEWVLADHGEEWRALPRARGFGVFAWLVPPLMLLAGLALVLTWVARARSQRGYEPVEARPLGTREQDVLAAAIRDMEAEEEEWF